MKRLVLIAAASAAFAGAAHATTNAGTAEPMAVPEFVATSNVELMALHSGVLFPVDVMVSNGRKPGFNLANEPGMISGVVVPPRLTNVGPLATVPEPTSWLMLIAGFGLVGAVARRRRVAIAA